MWSIIVIVALATFAGNQAAPRSSYGGLARYNAFGDYPMVERKDLSSFDQLKLGGGLGLAKRLRNPNKYETRSEKHRRGPLNGLIPGGAFGRSARSEFSRNYDNEPYIFPEDPDFTYEAEKSDSFDVQAVKALPNNNNNNNKPNDFYTSNQY